jgi:hypothetical protein
VSAAAGIADLDWLTPLAEPGPVPGLHVPLTVRYVVPKTADGDRTIEVSFAPETDGGVGEGAADDAAVVELTATPAVADQLVSGELAPNVAWMSGRLKASGPTGPLLAVLAHAESVTR